VDPETARRRELEQYGVQLAAERLDVMTDDDTTVKTKHDTYVTITSTDGPAALHVNPYALAPGGCRVNTIVNDDTALTIEYDFEYGKLRLNEAISVLHNNFDIQVRWDGATAVCHAAHVPTENTLKHAVINVVNDNDQVVLDELTQCDNDRDWEVRLTVTDS